MVYYTEIGIIIDWKTIVVDVIEKYKDDKSSNEIIKEMKESESEYFDQE